MFLHELMYQLPIDHLQTKEQIQLMTIYYDPTRDDAFYHPLFPSSKLFRLSFWDYCEDFQCKSYKTFHVSLKEHVHAMLSKNRKKITFQISKKGNIHPPHLQPPRPLRREPTTRISPNKTTSSLPASLPACSNCR